MSKYVLLGKNVQFSKAEDNFYKLQAFLWKAISLVQDKYDEWYFEQGTAANVINNSENFVRRLIESVVLEPLYSDLAKEYNLYGISKSDYFSACVDISAIDDVRSDAIEVYKNIQYQLEVEIEEREYNNELRKASQISFGIGDSLKNAAANAAHGIATSSGNATSREKAQKQRDELYNDFRELLWNQVKKCVVNCVSNYQDFVNARVANSILSNYDRESADAYLENAKTVPDKRDELLVKAFTKCPWNTDVYIYIFENYPNERRNIVSISKNYDVCLTKTINNYLSLEYTVEAQQNEALAIEAKKKVYQLMEEWGVEKSSVIDEIECDCLDRLTDGLNEADEATCNNIKALVEKYDALPHNKEQYFDLITKRIETIWAKEDGEIFDNYLINTNILCSKEVEQGKVYITEKGRTKDSKKYLTALEHCTQENIRKARIYHKINTSQLSFFKYIGWALIALGVLLLIVQEEFSIWTQILPIVIGGFYQYYVSTIKKEWEAITVNGKVINSVLLLSNEDFKSKRACAEPSSTNNLVKESKTEGNKE